MAGESQRRQTWFPYANAEFFLQFPDQRFLRPFAGFDLASGEFPKASHRFADRAFGEQDAAVGIDEGASGNENEFDAHGPGLEPRSVLVKTASNCCDDVTTLPARLTQA
jgi:hypothetical protein